MAETMQQAERRPNVQKRTANYRAVDHVRWLLGEQAFRDLQRPHYFDGFQDRRASWPWREYGPAELPDHVAKRGRRWADLERRVERVLPPSLRRFTNVLVRLDLDALAASDRCVSALGGLEKGCSIRESDRIERLQKVCRLILRRAGVSDAERKFAARQLARIDPVAEVVLDARPANGFTPREMVVGSFALSATACAEGVYLVAPPAERWPAFPSESLPIRLDRL